ncbi:hypothetical protein EBR25_05790 [bacterium]|nr:hypothetical protein [bacterium]
MRASLALIDEFVSCHGMITENDLSRPHLYLAAPAQRIGIVAQEQRPFTIRDGWSDSQVCGYTII